MKACHMCCGLKKACSTARAPGATRKIATSAPSTTRVLTVEMTGPLRPPPSSLAPRLLRENEPGGCQPPPSSREPRPLRPNEAGACQRSSGTPAAAPGGPTAENPGSGSAGDPAWLSSIRLPAATSGLDGGARQVDL